ncbi:transcriptional regulator, MerR family [Kribbella flavida DSM 17836]|uniref:Transcriptional regulator, MerR family n=1 Tax=Kribbella flavida (strain DSM 17836 / JCM 10339 / NBRC 14399) TaxID=479435 RepID=D2PL22_KRIFD|nr:MerR family transcriptional regulator [Kribbella flavida]ADB34277.1 transcriptional regulator, MerR family [Kribbella flavida DSM 17836]
MTASVTIGEFSRLTHLSVKTLHHYHDIGLLAPALIDPSSGYRRYRITQVPTAQLIRRLRELQMPLAQVREVVEAPDVTTRDQTLRLHLERMEQELNRTQQVVSSLRSMLTLPVTQLEVEYRFVPAFRAFAVTDRVHRDHIDTWCAATFGRLAALAGREEITATMGATYGDEFFTDDVGEVVGFLPVAPDQAPREGVELVDLPAAFFAVGVHAGPFADFDRTYGALGSHVAQYNEIAPGPIRELYVVGPGDTTDPTQFRTEVCWPIQRIPATKG